MVVIRHLSEEDICAAMDPELVFDVCNEQPNPLSLGEDLFEHLSDEELSSLLDEDWASLPGENDAEKMAAFVNRYGPPCADTSFDASPQIPTEFMGTEEEEIYGSAEQS